ncbi:MAG: hypothetical protein RL220_100 [Bacteroidota bacterium]
MTETFVGIIGSGAMGSGIAQVAAQSGHRVVITDISPEALEKASCALQDSLTKLVGKGKLSEQESDLIKGRIQYSTRREDLASCGLIIEAAVENLDIKKNIFRELDGIVKPDTVLGTNTSSLSITAIASACQHPQRVLGIHFFNPAPVMPLVEVIPALQTKPEVYARIMELMKSWNKVPVLAKDTPGFIVNRVARPYYGEALRIYEEGIADIPTIDFAMKDIMGFRMGPFELMDLIGNDVNYAVTESVFRSMYFDPRYRPSITQLKMTEAGWYGRKSGKGYYDYAHSATDSSHSEDRHLLQNIAERILAMLINESFDALYLGIATREDLDLAVTRGVNYPKGLIAWAHEMGLLKVVNILDHLYEHYREDRYRCSPGLRRELELHG